MEKESALHQLMDIRMNGVMNGITNSDGEYQEIIQKPDEYSGKLDKLNLPKEVRLLIDRYVSEQSTLGSRYGMPNSSHRFWVTSKTYYTEKKL